MSEVTHGDFGRRPKFRIDTIRAEAEERAEGRDTPLLALIAVADAARKLHVVQTRNIDFIVHTESSNLAALAHLAQALGRFEFEEDA